MGTGKTTKAIEHLKQYLASRHGQNIEVYVPRHDLADEWEQGLDGINARVVHVYPRTGGKWDENSRSYAHPIMCHRADYVRDLEANGHSIYGNACLSRASGEQCGLSSTCAYLDQFRISTDGIGLIFITRFEGDYGAGSELFWHINHFRVLAIEILLVRPLISIFEMPGE